MLIVLQLLMLTTNLPDTVRQPSSEEAVSVIHAPESFTSWVGPLAFDCIALKADTDLNVDVNGAYSPSEPAKRAIVSTSRREQLYYSQWHASQS